MFEHMKALQETKNHLFDDLVPMAPQAVEDLRKPFPGCPDAYFMFLLEWGTGPVRPENEDKEMASGLLLRDLPVGAIEFFGDRDILNQGAKADVLIFAIQSDGWCFGFDTGANYQLSEISDNRDVDHWNITFDKFIEGDVKFYPDFASEYREGTWFGRTGESLPN